MKEKVGSEFFRCQKKYYRIYDTFALLDTADHTDGAEEAKEPEGVECHVRGAGLVTVFPKRPKKSALNREAALKASEMGSEVEEIVS